MARQISMETLNAKIEKAEQNVIRTKKAYESATEELKKLLDKRDADCQPKRPPVPYSAATL